MAGRSLEVAWSFCCQAESAQFGRWEMNFDGISSVFFNLEKSTLNAICGVPEHLAILLFVFDV